ncbi:MAG: hypothetical protein IT423_10045 [Pirellulaceae bacterium]|nr:hypothetical protein [Pirellulaceae bacterium]
MTTNRPIVPGITINAQGQANIDASMSEVLFDLAIKLEEVTNLPVDVQHVVAALVLAERSGDVAPTQAISASDSVLVSSLVSHVKSVFALFGGQLGDDD